MESLSHTPPAVDLREFRALFIAPHLDDVAHACGGIVARTVATGAPSLIVTVFAGEPHQDRRLSAFARFQHERWGTADKTTLVRRQEDARAAATLGAASLWLPHLDAIYRGDQYLSDEDLFGPVKPDDVDLIPCIAEDLIALWRQTREASVYLPLGVGNHVDHQICHAAGPLLEASGVTVWYYEEFPYAATPGAVAARLAVLDRPLASLLVDVTTHLDRRLAAMAAYSTQLPVVFRHYGPFEEITRRYAAELASAPDRYAERLWRSPVSTPSVSMVEGDRVLLHLPRTGGET